MMVSDEGDWFEGREYERLVSEFDAWCIDALASHFDVWAYQGFKVGDVDW